MSRFAHQKLFKHTSLECQITHIASTACVRTQAQNYHKQLSADRDKFSQGSIPNPLFILLTFPLEVLDLLSMI